MAEAAAAVVEVIEAVVVLPLIKETHYNKYIKQLFHSYAARMKNEK